MTSQFVTEHSVFIYTEAKELQEISRREREKINRRGEILQAAKKVFASKEYDAATIDDIATAAELSKGAIYLYFKNKADLFISTFEMGMQKFSSLTRDVLSSNEADPVKGIKELIRLHLIFCEENTDMFKIMSSERAHFETHWKMSDNKAFKQRLMSTMADNISAMADFVQRGIDSEVFKPIDPKSFSIALISAIHGLTARWIMEHEKFKLREKADTIITIFLDGLRKN